MGCLAVIRPLSRLSAHLAKPIDMNQLKVSLVAGQLNRAQLLPKRPWSRPRASRGVFAFPEPVCR